ncbi:hypothetical protein LINPERHAP2_LOCUS8711 [Linum perenne]
MECQTLNQSHPTTWFDDELILHHHSPFYFIPDEQRSPNPIAHLLLSSLHSNSPPRFNLDYRAKSDAKNEISMFLITLFSILLAGLVCLRGELAELTLISTH